jgi:ribosomal protein S18 acetylase RimI-like enzyme
MAGLDGWTGNTVSMHVACRNPHVIRQLARAAFTMAFITCGKKIALCTVKGTNDRSLRLVRGVGFREVFRGVDYFADGVDFVGHEMRRDECRWLVKGAA